MNAIDLHQLKCFLTVAREGQVTRAARVLNMAQPPLSRQLQLIEQELGVTLFDRTGHRLRLTDAGRLLSQKAESLLLQFDETIREVQERGEGMQGMLSIGSVFSCISLLPGRIEQFRKAFPQVTFRILEGDHYYLGEQLEVRNIELVVARLPFEAMASPQQYEVLPLPSDPFVAVVPSFWRSRFAEEAIEMRELAELPFVTLKTDKTTRMHEQVVEECRRHGFEPNIVCECSSVAIIMALIAEGIGVTLFPESVMSSFPTNAVTALPLADTDFQSGVGVLWMKERYLSKSARRFIDSFRPV